MVTFDKFIAKHGKRKVKLFAIAKSYGILILYRCAHLMMILQHLMSRYLLSYAICMPSDEESERKDERKETVSQQCAYSTMRTWFRFIVQLIYSIRINKPQADTIHQNLLMWALINLFSASWNDCTVCICICFRSRFWYACCNSYLTIWSPCK